MKLIFAKYNYDDKQLSSRAILCLEKFVKYLKCFHLYKLLIHQFSITTHRSSP